MAGVAAKSGAVSRKCCASVARDSGWKGGRSALQWLMAAALTRRARVDACDAAPGSPGTAAVNEDEVRHVKVLDVSRSKLTSLECVAAYRQVQELLAARNDLVVLPSSISLLTNLRVLNLSNNKLAALSSGIGQLRRLRTLVLAQNRLPALPSALGQLDELQTLYLEDNQLTLLPNSIGNLRSLRTLYLDRNSLVDLPRSMRRLSALRLLSVRRNRLSQLHDDIGDLENLQVLMLAGNKLSSLPGSLGHLPSARLLDLSDNRPLQRVPGSLLLSSQASIQGLCLPSLPIVVPRVHQEHLQQPVPSLRSLAAGLILRHPELCDQVDDRSLPCDLIDELIDAAVCDACGAAFIGPRVRSSPGDVCDLVLMPSCATLLYQQGSISA